MFLKHDISCMFSYIFPFMQLQIESADKRICTQQHWEKNIIESKARTLVFVQKADILFIAPQQWCYEFDSVFICINKICFRTSAQVRTFASKAFFPRWITWWLFSYKKDFLDEVCLW